MKKILFILSSVVILIFLSLGIYQEKNQIKTPTSFVLAAHRGGSGEEVESQMSAFEHAIKSGVTTLEMDLQVTKDGIIVLNHNPNTNGNYDRNVVISNTNWSQLKTLKNKVNGQSMVTLKELTDKYHNDLSVKFMVEIKNPQDTKTIIEFVKNSGIKNRFIIQSFYQPVLDQVRNSLPKVPTLKLSANLNASIVDARNVNNTYLGAYDKIAQDLELTANWYRKKIITWHDVGSSFLKTEQSINQYPKISGDITEYPNRAEQYLLILR